MSDTWMAASHYHCKDCQRELVFWTRISWKLDTGVTAIGGCSACGNVMIECETIPPRWLKLSDAK